MKLTGFIETVDLSGVCLYSIPCLTLGSHTESKLVSALKVQMVHSLVASVCFVWHTAFLLVSMPHL